MSTAVLSQAENDTTWSQYASMLAEDGHDDFPASLYGIERQFKGIDITGKTVLEIGSGKGLMAIYAAMKGADRVLSMEPEMEGSRSGVLDLQRQRIETLGLSNVDLLRTDFNDWEPDGVKCDVVALFAVINHLHESPHHALHHNDTFDRYVDVAGKIRSLLKPDGVAVVTDACRYGFFWWAKKFGIQPPWTRKPVTINWRIHQNPRTWNRIFRAAGFQHTRVLYPVPRKLRLLSPLVNTSVANFFLHSSFIMHCYA